MKKIKGFKTGCVLLLLILSMGLIACQKESAPEYDESIHLEVIDKPVEYTSDDLISANGRFTKIGVSLFGERYEERISNEFDTTVIPMIYRIKIYKNELNAVFDEIEKHVAAGESGKPVFLTFYDVCQYILGTERAGQICYSTSVRMLENRTENALNNYDKLGYTFYKETAERCTALKNSIISMGEGKFAIALSMTSSVISINSSINAEIQESAFMLSDAEILFLLEKTADSFEKKQLSEDEWEIFGGWFSEIIAITRLTPSDDDINKTTLYALKNYTFSDVYDENDPNTLYKSSYFASAMRVMPRVISLYTNLARNLKADGKFSLEGTKEEKRIALLSALSKCEKSLSELDSALNEYAKIDESYLKSKITNTANAEEINCFISSRTALSSAEVIDILTEIRNGKEINDGEINDILIDYVYGISPNLAYVLSVNTNILN